MTELECLQAIAANTDEIAFHLQSMSLIALAVFLLVGFLAGYYWRSK